MINLYPNSSNKFVVLKFMDKLVEFVFNDIKEMKDLNDIPQKSINPR